MSWIPQLILFINYIIFKIKNKKRARKRMKRLLYLQSALQPFLYSSTILYNNNVSKKKIYIYIYYFFILGFPYLIWAFGAYRVRNPMGLGILFFKLNILFFITKTKL